MANSRSALKRVRQTATRTKRNRVMKNRIKDTRKDALEAIEAGDTKKAAAAYNELASSADLAAKRGTIHKNAAARLKARLAKKVNALSSK